jgi:cyclophilin family peptidyl-prolyl cis-trans isomerase
VSPPHSVGLGVGLCQHDVHACLIAWSRESTKLFRGLCDGSIPDFPGVTYRGSIATRVEKNKAIVLGRPPSGSAQEVERSIDNTGYVRSQLVNRAERYANSDSNDLRHDRPGVVSMQRGGGSFEFVIAPKANPGLDKENVVIGQVLLDNGSGRDLLNAINDVPVRQPKAETSVYGFVAKAAGDPRTRVETVYRPLRKVSISRCDTR